MCSSNGIHLCSSPVNHELEQDMLSKCLLDKPQLNMGMYTKSRSPCTSHVFYWSQQLVIKRVSVSFVSPPCTKIVQGMYGSTEGGELALTDASVVLFSFPMAQPAAGPRLPKPAASHISRLKDTSTEGPSAHDRSQTHTERTGDLWSPRWSHTHALQD